MPSGLKKADWKQDFLKIPAFFDLKRLSWTMTKREMKIGVFSTQKGELYYQTFTQRGTWISWNWVPPPSVRRWKTAPRSNRLWIKANLLEKPWLVSLRNLFSWIIIRSESKTKRNSEPVPSLQKNLKVKGGEHFDPLKIAKGDLLCPSF